MKESARDTELPPAGLCLQAEQRIVDTPLQKFERTPEVLLHELRVHQLELEMQNEELRRTQLSLEAYRDRYLDLYERAPVGYLTLSDSGVIAEANLTAARLFGVARERLLKRRFDHFLATDKERWRSLFVAEMANGSSWSIDVILKRGDDSTFPTHCDCLRSPAGAGAPEMRVALTDITARRLAEVALREREEKMRSIFRAAPIGIGVIRDRNFLEVNDRFCDMVGYSRDELVGQSSRLVYPGDEEYELVGREKYRQIAERGVGTVETRFRHRDGHIIQVLLSSSPIDPSDLSLGLSFTSQDITEQKEKQAELERLTRTERAIGHINQALLHATDEAGFLDEVCRIVVEDCGHAMIWIGIAEQDEGRTVRPIAHAGFEQGYLDTLRITWADSERGRGPTGAAIRTGQPCYCRNMAEDDNFSPWRAEALKRGYASSAAFPLRDARGGVIGALSIYSREIDPFTAEETDLLGVLAGDLAFGMRTLRLRAEHAEAESTMVALRGEFQQLLEWQVASQTVAAIAHEVGQPLNAVTTFGEAALMLLENISPRPQKLAQAVQGMAVQAERAGHVLRELMQFLRHSEATMDGFDLDDLVRCAVALARADRSRIGRITLIGMPDLGPVWGNRLQIEKVLLNLIFNGMDAMRDAGLSGKDAGMTVILARDGDKARVTVSDMGPGIEQMNAQRIFEPFFSSKAKGIGMGLSISRALVEAHGGRLWLDPSSDQGATFHFTIPFAP